MTHHAPVLVLNAYDVETLLDLDALIDALASAMADLSAGRASLPPRVAAHVADRDAISAAMPAYVPSIGALTTKVVNLFPGNAGSRYPTHQAVILAFDPATGAPVALLDGTRITALRTAAGSALSVRLLARGDARTLAILGTGVQARSHLRLVPRVAHFEDVRIAGRDAVKAKALAEEAGSLGLPARACESSEACEGADVICATTHAAEPVVRRTLVAAGTHITSVGYNTKGTEVDAETIRDSLLVVESRAAVLAPVPAGSTDIQWAIRDGTITEDHIHAEIGEIVSGSRPGRTSDDQITLYKSVGVAVQDAAAAALVLDAARRSGAGTVIDL